MKAETVVERLNEMKVVKESTRQELEVANATLNKLSMEMELKKDLDSQRASQISELQTQLTAVREENKQMEQEIENIKIKVNLI